MQKVVSVGVRAQFVWLLFAAGCGSESAHAVTAPTRPEPPDVTPQWTTQAEEESATYLRNRCFEVAPLEYVDATDPTFDLCFRRAEAAIERGWKEESAAAQTRCVQSGVSCCFALTPSRVDIAGQARAAERVKECNLACANQLGRAPAEHQDCHPTSVLAGSTAMERRRTPDLKAIVSACPSDHTSMQRCATLRTTAEQQRCSIDCAVAIELPLLERASDACVASGGPVESAVCHFKSPLGDPIYSEANCTDRCRGILARRAAERGVRNERP